MNYQKQQITVESNQWPTPFLPITLLAAYDTEVQKYLLKYILKTLT